MVVHGVKNDTIWIYRVELLLFIFMILNFNPSFRYFFHIEFLLILKFRLAQQT